ncbi:MAG TPA: hypothetical protein VHW60_08980, partial [Caulobacteraceae bacterium]|nr:hypothetical protein [Caulobacteraceae bacterium]
MRLGLLGLAAATLAAATPAPSGDALPLRVSLAATGWTTYANGSADQRFPLTNDAAGALTFAFPEDVPPFFLPGGRSPTAPSADYLFTTAPLPDLTGAHTLTATFTVTAAPGAAFNAKFEASNTCPAGPTVRLLLETPGPLTNWTGATLPYTRWYGPPTPLTPGPHTLTVPLSGAAWTDVYADRGDATHPPPGQSQTPA